MIYVISPYLLDVVAVCEMNNINCPTKNGKILNSRIQWIHDLTQLFSVRILKTDTILFGDKCTDFPPEQFESLLKEINSRKLYGNS